MTDPQQHPSSEQPLVQHLLELRDRLMRVVLAVTLIFLCLFAFANDLYTYLAAPLLQHMAVGTSMIATQVVSPFLTPFKLALVLSIFIAVPYILYQAWGFMAPGLYQHERRLIFPLLFSSTVLFYMGMAFAYFVVFPLVFGFLTGVAPEGVAVMPDITYYLDFAIKMFFAFGLAFEVPIATILVVWSGISTAESLSAKRPYVIVGAFVVGMLLTPPDVISQTLLALPMWALFELGLLFSRFYARPKQPDADDENQIGGAMAAATTSAAARTRVEPTFTQSSGEATDTTYDAATVAKDYGDNDADSDEFEDANDSGHGEFEPLTEEEMDAELDRLEADEAAAENSIKQGAAKNRADAAREEQEASAEDDAPRKPRDGQ